MQHLAWVRRLSRAALESRWFGASHLAMIPPRKASGMRASPPRESPLSRLRSYRGDVTGVEQPGRNAAARLRDTVETCKYGRPSDFWSMRILSVHRPRKFSVRPKSGWSPFFGQSGPRISSLFQNLETSLSVIFMQSASRQVTSSPWSATLVISHRFIP